MRTAKLKFKKVKFDEGDILIVKYPKSYGTRGVEHLVKHFGEFDKKLKNHGINLLEILVIPEDISLSVLSPKKPIKVEKKGLEKYRLIEI